MTIPVFYAGLVYLSLTITVISELRAQEGERLSVLKASSVSSRAERRVVSLRDLVREMCKRHITARRRGGVTQPFFSVRGQILKIKGVEIQAFEYRSIQTARKEAELVRPDGSTVGTNMVTWIEGPHFFRSGKLIILYVGDKPDVIELLGHILGNQFAGR